ncbi:hypothetical protein LOD99_12703 [Oopsacas minuta]|uniref:Uncharacterized protein n=1 Tax=Oopsacas minuta TaxID=111878 RepID=A0AAV7JCV4_9METZ|nr:hypothetical protein LOD99_12703 [Oopsacas minuta]
MNFISALDFSKDHLESKLVRSFDKYTLKQPRGIASHFPLQLLFVSDGENNSIIVFDVTLQFITRFKFNGMVEPWNICFNNDYEILYVICDHGIIRFNGDYPMFCKPGFELRGCAVYNDRVFSAACYLNQIHEFDKDMTIISNIQPDVKDRKETTLIIDFVICNECLFLLFINCPCQLQVFDFNGKFLNYFFDNISLRTPLFLTHYLNRIYISQRDRPEVACVKLEDDDTHIFTLSIKKRGIRNNGEWKIKSPYRPCGIFYGIEFSPVYNCLIMCEML